MIIKARRKNGQKNTFIVVYDHFYKDMSALKNLSSIS
jgi:hypothetical protein